MMDNVLIDTILGKTRDHTGKIALIEKDIPISYPEMWEKVTGYSKTFAELGLTQGRIVVVYLDNGVQLALVFLALLKAGASPLIVNKERVHSIHFNDLNYYCLISNFPAKETDPFFTTRDNKKTTIDGFYLLPANSYIAPEKPPRQVLLLTSSGSTGISKIIALTPAGALKNIKSNCRSLGISSTDTSLLFLPMSYSYGLIAQFLTHLYAGATIVFANNNLYLLQIAGMIHRYSISTLFTVPTILRQFLALHHPGDFQDRFSTLRCVTIGGNHADAHTLKKASRFFKCPVVVTYGLAEAGPRVCTRFIHSAREKDLSSVGTPIDGVKIRILGKRGLPLPQGEPGRICVVSPSVALGYLNRPSEDIVPGRQILTRDIGYVNARGRLIILGRMDNHILLSNRKVWFFEIEDLLYATGKIAKAYIEKKDNALSLQLLKITKCKLTEQEVGQLLRRKFGKEIETRTAVSFVAATQLKMTK